MTKIPWTENSINPIVGCSKVSPGCENCYAEKMAARLNTMYVSGYSDLIIKNWKWTGRTCFIESVLEKPLRRKKPTMYFVCSMGDFLHETVKQWWLHEIIEVVRKCPHHIFQFLTKRPERFWEYEWKCSKYGWDYTKKLPDNLWLGVTIEDNAHLYRAEVLQGIPAAVWFVSVEPMLERVEIPDEIMRRLGWVIIGCESGTGRRPCKQGWISSLRTECRHAGVPVFVKQIEVNGKVSKDPSEWPGHLRIQQWPILRE